MPWHTSDRASRLPKNWPSIRRKVLLRDGYRCRINGEGCQRHASEADHIVAGDDHSLTNLQAACRRCHARKSAAEGNARKAALRAARFRRPEKHPGRRNTTRRA